MIRVQTTVLGSRRLRCSRLRAWSVTTFVLMALCWRRLCLPKFIPTTAKLNLFWVYFTGILMLVFLTMSSGFVLQSTARTVSNYEGRAISFADWASGSEAAAAQSVRDALTSRLGHPSNGPIKILDVGCGPGRDLLQFATKGVFAVGIDPSPSFCRMAKQTMRSSGMDNFAIYEGDVCDSALMDTVRGNHTSFDGVFCLASLFHIPVSQLHTALQNIKKVMKPGGLLLSSFPLDRTGASSDLQAYEGETGSDGRWVTVLTEASHKELLQRNGFSPLSGEEGGTSQARIYNGLWLCVLSRA